MTRIDVTPYVAAWRERRKQEQRQLIERTETKGKCSMKMRGFAGLRADIQLELNNLERLVEEVKDLPTDAPANILSCYGPQAVTPGTCHRSSSSVATWTM